MLPGKFLEMKITCLKFLKLKNFYRKIFEYFLRPKIFTEMFHNRKLCRKNFLCSKFSKRKILERTISPKSPGKPNILTEKIPAAENPSGKFLEITKKFHKF